MSSILKAAAINMAVTATLQSSLPTVTGNAMVNDSTNVSPSIGSTAGSADGVFTAVGNVSAGTPVTIDFTAITFVDPFGNAVTAGHVVGLKLSNLNTNVASGSLTHGGGSNALYSAFPLAIDPSDAMAQTFNGKGLAVSGSTKILQLNASSGTVTYQVTALARSG